MVRGRVHMVRGRVESESTMKFRSKIIQLVPSDHQVIATAESEGEGNNLSNSNNMCNNMQQHPATTKYTVATQQHSQYGEVVTETREASVADDNLVLVVL